MAITVDTGYIKIEISQDNFIYIEDKIQPKESKYHDANEIRKETWGVRYMGNEIKIFNRGISFVRKHINKDIAISHLAIFLEVCLQEGLTMNDLVEKLDLPQASISRSTKELSKYIERDPKTNEKKLVGYDLIRTEPDLEERRRLVLYLTPKGRQVKELLQKYMKEGS